MKVDPIKDLRVIYGSVKDQNANTAAYPSATTGFDMSPYEDALIIVALGVVDNSATIDVVVSTSASTNGTYANVTGATLTLVGTDDSQVYVGNLRISERNPFVRVTPTVSSHSVLGAVIVVGVNPRVAPVTQAVTTSTKTFNV